MIRSMLIFCMLGLLVSCGGPESETDFEAR